MPGSLASLAGLLQVYAAHAGHASSARLAEDCLAVLHFICDNAVTAQQQQQQKDARALLLSAAGVVEAVAAVLLWGTSSSWATLHRARSERAPSIFLASGVAEICQGVCVDRASRAACLCATWLGKLADTDAASRSRMLQMPMCCRGC